MENFCYYGLTCRNQLHAEKNETGRPCNQEAYQQAFYFMFLMHLLPFLSLIAYIYAGAGDIYADAGENIKKFALKRQEMSAIILSWIKNACKNRQTVLNRYFSEKK